MEGGTADRVTDMEKTTACDGKVWPAMLESIRIRSMRPCWGCEKIMAQAPGDSLVLSFCCQQARKEPWPCSRAALLHKAAAAAETCDTITSTMHTARNILIQHDARHPPRRTPEDPGTTLGPLGVTIRCREARPMRPLTVPPPRLHPWRRRCEACRGAKHTRGSSSSSSRPSPLGRTAWTTICPGPPRLVTTRTDRSDFRALHSVPRGVPGSNHETAITHTHTGPARC